MQDVVASFRKVAEERRSEFGFPRWIEIDCPVCQSNLFLKDIQDLSIHFTPMFLGDVSFDYFCSQCGSLICMHLKCDVKNLQELISILGSDKQHNLVLREKLINMSHHNVLKSMSKKVE